MGLGDLRILVIVWTKLLCIVRVFEVWSFVAGVSYLAGLRGL